MKLGDCRLCYLCRNRKKSLDTGLSHLILSGNGRLNARIKKKTFISLDHCGHCSNILLKSLRKQLLELDTFFITVFKKHFY